MPKAPKGSGRGPGERLYAALLRAYPRRHREQYDVALMQVFRHHRDERLRTRGRLGAGFWLFMLRDVLASSWKERREPLESNGRRSVRPDKGGDGMKGWIDDFAYAVRRLWRSPGFSLTALVILVLGIGVNTTAFSLVNALLLQPPPFRDVEAVVDVLQDSDDGRPNSTSYPAFQDIARTEGVFASVAAITSAQGFMEQDGSLVSVSAEYATSGYMRVLGLAPSRGRWFDEAEDLADGQPAAVITHKMWRDRLGSDPDVIGSTLRIGGTLVTVVGVGPAEFNGGAGPAVTDMWLSISALRPTGSFAAQSLDRRQDHPFLVRARLLPGVSVDQAQAAMTRLGDELAVTYPTINEGRRIHVLSVSETRIHPQVDGQLLPAAALLMAVVVLVLVIATLNLANLLLVRTTSRAREIAVRLAMGAGRARVARVVLSEALVLAFLGGIGGLVAAIWIMNLLGSGRFDFAVPVKLDVRLDATVLWFTAMISTLSGIVFGLVPALRVTSRDLSASLRDEAGVSMGARRRFGLTGVMVAGQVAVSLVLLAVASVFLESLVRARGVDPGFDWQRTAYAQVSLNPLGVSGEEAAVLYRRLEERLEATPGVERSTLSVQLPGALFGTTTLLLGSGLGGVDEPREIPWNFVAVDYFDVLGIKLVEGRSFVPSDGDGAPVTIVSEAMARAYWGRTDVVGELIRREATPDDPQEIIGVVSDVIVRALGEAPTPTIYWPYTSGGASRGNLLLQTTGDPDGVLGDVRRVIRDVDSRILLLELGTMRDHLGATLSQQRLAGGVLSAMGLLALLLAVLGVYGVVSFAVSRRQREVGIRQALGADGSAVVRLFVRDVAGVVVAGTVLGLVVALPAGRLVGEWFTGGGGNPLLIGGVSLVLLAAALIATVIPAVRATRTDPTITLRQE